MKTLFEKFHKTSVEGVEIKFEITFNKNDFTFGTGQPRSIGYEVMATPMTVERWDGENGECRIESFFPLTGFYENILEVERQSKNRLAQAIKIFEEKEKGYLDYFRERGYVIE